MSNSEKQGNLKMELPIHNSPQTPTKDDTLNPYNGVKKSPLRDLVEGITFLFCYSSSYQLLMILRPFGFSVLELAYFNIHMMILPSGYWVYKWTSRNSREKDGDGKKPLKEVSKEDKSGLGIRTGCLFVTLIVGFAVGFFIVGFGVMFLNAFIVATLYIVVLLPHGFENLTQTIPSIALKIIGRTLPAITNTMKDAGREPLTCHCDCASYARSMTGLKVEETLCQLDKAFSLSELSLLHRVALFFAFNLLIAGLKYGYLRLKEYIKERRLQKGKVFLAGNDDLEGKAMLE